MYITRFTNKVHFCNDFVLYCNLKKILSQKHVGDLMFPEVKCIYNMAAGQLFIYFIFLKS